MRGFIGLLKRFRSDEGGAFMVLFGVMAIVLVAMAGAAVDYTAVQQARSVAQNALDSAALGLAPTIYDNGVTADTLKADAEALVLERVRRDDLEIDITSAVPNKDSGTLRLEGSITVPMAFVQLVGIRTMTAGLTAEATRGSTNLEVSVALDNTGSMGGDIEFLREGLHGIIDIVVKDRQKPTYSKMAIIPWTEEVNLGKYADTVRGPIPAAKSITSFYWAGPQYDITNATKAKPIVVTTSANHGYSVGDIVYINGVTGMTQLNGKFYRVGAKTNTTISLQTSDGTNTNIDGTTSSYGAFTGGSTNNNDKVRKCLTWVSSASACEVYVSATAHGFATGDYIRTNSDASSSTYRDKLYTITKVDNNTFRLDGITSTSATAPLATGGGAWCTTYGCEWYRYKRKNSTSYNTWRVSKCVTERKTNSYTEVPPSTTYLGLNYDNTSGTCDLPQVVTPLTSDKETLHAEADKMAIYGSTAGHIGTAWSWYMLSPDWGYIWDDPDMNVPAAYDAPNTLKIAIIMTDGDYNTQFCNGVNEGSIDCSAIASSTSQARSVCAEMKKKAITVYTVGFRIKKNSTQGTTLTQCATDASKVFLPATGADLVDAFKVIGQNITDLRLSM